MGELVEPTELLGEPGVLRALPRLDRREGHRLFEEDLPKSLPTDRLAHALEDEGLLEKVEGPAGGSLPAVVLGRERAKETMALRIVGVNFGSGPGLFFG